MCPDTGVELRYKVGRKLVGDRTSKSCLQHLNVTESQFAGDAALYALSKASFDRCSETFVACASGWGLTVSLTKTKAISINTPTSVPVHLGNGTIDAVDQFTYLGSVIHWDGFCVHDVPSRISKAS